MRKIKPACVVGIDPGVTGAIAAILDDQKTCIIFDMPTITEVNAKRKEQVLDIVKFMDIMSTLSQKYELRAFVEHTQPMKDSAMTAFSMGQMRGNLIAILVCKSIAFEEVTPQEWKKFHRLLRCDKDASRKVASEKLPLSRDKFERKKDHNRAEAALIAAYGFTRIYKEPCS